MVEDSFDDREHSQEDEQAGLFVIKRRRETGRGRNRREHHERQ
jgi:hypothetical protein